MSFHDLPPDWAERPMTDPAITADVLDLVVRDADRDSGAVAALMCNPAGRLVQPAVVTLPPGGVQPGDHRRFFDVVCAGMVAACGEADPGGILVAVARPGRPVVTPDDRAWLDAAGRSCTDHGVRLLGTWLVTGQALVRVDGVADPSRLTEPRSA
jgi:hypothetical protein